jgi:hypothetical protein
MELNHINVWLLDDDAGWMLVDTGMAHDVCRAAWHTLDGYLQGRPLRRIFITHDHPDHMGLSRWLHERTTPPCGCRLSRTTRSRHTSLHPRTNCASASIAFLLAHGMHVSPSGEPQHRGGREDSWFKARAAAGAALRRRRPVHGRRTHLGLDRDRAATAVAIYACTTRSTAC